MPRGYNGVTAYVPEVTTMTDLTPQACTVKPTMTGAQRQARWRRNNSLRRVELYLPPEVVEALDELGREYGAARRAEVVEGLLAGTVRPPSLVDLHREVAEAYRAVLQAGTYRRLWATDVRTVPDDAVQRLGYVRTGGACC
jgi:hypothetical protein